MELTDVWRIVWKGRLTVLAVLIATMAFGAAFALLTTKHYESTATIAFTPNASKGPADSLRPEDVSSLLQTYASTAKSKDTIIRAEAILGHKLPGTLSTSILVGTGILRLGDRASSPQAAVAAAAAAAAAFIDSLKGNGLVDAQVVDPPLANATPVQPRPPLVLGVALFLGLAAGCTLAIVLDYSRRRVATADDVAAVTDVPVLGHLAYKRSMARDRTKPIVWDSTELVDIQESIRALRTNLQLMSPDAPRCILVTSATASEGKSTLVANLGIALSQARVDTLILDADMRNPRQHTIFELDNSDGLSTLLEQWGNNGRGPGVRPRPTRYERLSVLTAGPSLATSTELLYTRFRPVLAELLSAGSFVLIDSPPLLPVADARIIAADADVTLMVVNARTERPQVLRSAVEKLRLADARVTGIVLNQTAQAEARGYDSYYYSSARS
jgi:capsular exopolysaccharide synthesis family protein